MLFCLTTDLFLFFALFPKFWSKLFTNTCLNLCTVPYQPSSTDFFLNRSTLFQLLTFLNDVHSSLQCKSQTDVIYLDFQKAFDSIFHNELLTKLWCIGIRGKIWCWLQADLSQRLHCVSINCKKSNLLPVISGVPQGRILRPLLFLILINDLPDCVNSSAMLLYA